MNTHSWQSTKRPAIAALEHFVVEMGLKELFWTLKKVMVLRAASTYPFDWFLKGEPNKASNLVLHQTMKSECLNLQAKGFQVAAAPAKECDGVLFFPTRQKQESLYWLGIGIESLRASGGYLIGACENNLGAKSYLRALHEAGIEPDCGSKARSIAFCAKIDKQNLDYGQIEAWLKYGEIRPIADSPYLTRAGIFSVDELDAGSTLLLQNLPGELSGNGADFGAGNGYLGLEILRTRPEISSVTLFENERLALDAAQQSALNLGLNDRCKLAWSDITREAPTSQFEWIVMNPPFHDEYSEDKGLGERFIAAAAKALKNGGQLFMVANEHLAYQRMLQGLFSKVEIVVKQRGYAIYRGTASLRGRP